MSDDRDQIISELEIERDQATALRTLVGRQTAKLAACVERVAYLLPIVEGLLATRRLEDDVQKHHEQCDLCGSEDIQTATATCAELDRLCAIVEMSNGQFESDLSYWELSDARAELALSKGL